LDSQRLFLFLIFSFSLFLLIDAWQKDHAPTPAAAAKGDTSQVMPGPTGGQVGGQVPTPGKVAQPAAQTAVPAASGVASTGERIVVETDLFRGVIDTLGGDIKELVLLRHGGTLDPAKPFTLLEQNSERTYVFQTGLIGPDLPTHLTRFQAARQKFVMEGDVLDVDLETTTPGGVKVVKTLSFKRGSYVIQVSYRIANETTAKLAVHAYFQLLRDGKPPVGDSSMVPTYTGVAVYTDKEKFQKVAFGDLDKNKASHERAAQDGWIAMLQHYFLTAILPAQQAPREYYTKRLESGLYTAGIERQTR